MLKRILARNRSLSIHMITFWLTIALWALFSLAAWLFYGANS
jgi:hypothetical protein